MHFLAQMIVIIGIESERESKKWVWSFWSMKMCTMQNAEGNKA